MMRTLIDIDAEQCQSLSTVLKKEWLVANGVGGYASSTIAGANTRKYHGLLVASLAPPLKRLMVLAKIDETIHYDNRPHLLSTNIYDGRIHPTGYQYLVNFRLAPFPVFTYIVEDLEIEKRIFVPHGHNAVIVKYALLTKGAEAELRVYPLVAFRGFKELRRETQDIEEQITIEPGVVRIRPSADLPELWLGHNAGVVTPTIHWHKDFVYEREKEETGDEAVEDLLNPCEISYRLRSGEEAYLEAGLERDSLGSVDAKEKAEMQRLSQRFKACGSLAADARCDALAAAGDGFVVRSVSGTTIVAGYHGLTEEGRVALQSLPGLLLCSKRYEEAREVLLRYASFMKHGRLPRVIAEDGEHMDYQAVDVPLLLFIASEEYYRATGDVTTIANPLYAVLGSILQYYKEQMVPGVNVDADGLLVTGVGVSAPLTWMDEQTASGPITPRVGKCVEINAMWYNAHKILAHFSSLVEDVARTKQYEEEGERILESFGNVFWNEARGYLNDVVSATGVEATLRPNQVFALSLPYPLVEGERAEKVIEAINRSLVTTFGLRSLARNEPGYFARCDGDMENRKRALHRGTVHPWLIGPYIEALLRVKGESARTHAAGFSLLQAFMDHLEDGGLGSISQIFDGDTPHMRCGCNFYALSVAEIVRAFCRLHAVKKA